MMPTAILRPAPRPRHAAGRRGGAALTFVLMLAWMVLAQPARAGLFDDDEARKAILDLRNRIAQSEEQQRGQLNDAVKRLNEQIQQLQRSLLDLNNQNEQLRAELARLRGQDEQQQRDLAELQRKQKDIAQGVDERVRKLEPQKVSLDGKEFTAEPEEIRQYEEAMGWLRNGEFDKATQGLSAFLKRYPATGYRDTARYWLGNAQYGVRDYKEAIATFRAFLQAAPEHVRAPEAQLALANCQVEMRDNKAARKTLEDLLKVYPRSEAAVAAKERLLTVK